jgi:hypothetical protein
MFRTENVLKICELFFLADVQPLCTNFPLPDLKTGLLLTSPQAGVALYPGEYAVYNCTDAVLNVTDWGALFALQCVNGAVNPPAVWPVCRAPLA